MEEAFLFTERRTAKRKPARFTMRYKIVGEDAPFRIATTLNISSESVLFEVDEQIPLGARIEAEIVVPSATKTIQFKGSIKRIEKLETSLSTKDKFLHAVVFEEIEKQFKDALERFVQVKDIDSILRLAIKKEASDVHLVANQPPVFRIQGELIPVDTTPFSTHGLRKMIISILTERQRTNFEQNLELDFSYLLPEGIRFRVNVHLERGNMEAAFRIIPVQIRTVAELGLPPVVEDLARRRKGLVIVTGPAGSGKSTTLAAMVDLINRERRCMIISIEEPIEYVYKSKGSIIKQREVGLDTLSFASALKHSLRQDPNVILVGEMRDLESISMAITAAETGHLVLATLHTADSVECINRIIDVYPAEQQSQVASQLTASLEGIIAQLLLPRKDGEGRILATEVLVVTPPIRNLLRTRRYEQIYSYIESGSQYGMQSMDDSLLKLVQNDLIDLELAMGFAKTPSRLRI